MSLRVWRYVFRGVSEPRVKSAWDAAYSLHVWGFHEAKLAAEDVELDLPQVEWLLEYVEKLVKSRGGVQ